LRQNELLSDDDQKKYYAEVIKPSFFQLKPRIILFSFLLAGECIGYGGLTNIDWRSKRTEFSFLLDTKRADDQNLYAKEMSVFVSLIKIVAFEELKMNRLFAETFDIRNLHISVLEKNGFNYEGRMKQHVFINRKYVDSILHGMLGGINVV
jgi:RimJ/RimL family protein N-acetyltransferase